MYASKYTDRQITFAQYVAELCCERAAQKQKKKLEPHFWNDKEWKALFLRQKTLAGNLLKTYSEGAIIQGLKNVKWAYSLATKALISEIERLHNLTQEPDLVTPEIKIEQRTETKQKSILDLI